MPHHQRRSTCDAHNFAGAKTIAWLIALASAAAVNLPGACASVVIYTDRSSFETEGVIDFNANFNDFSTGSTNLVGVFYREGVTYTSTQNSVNGPTAGFGHVTNLMHNLFWSPVAGSIDPGFSMFGFDIGVLGRQDLQTIEIVTNAGVYTYPSLTLADGSVGLNFLGFVSSPGETIQSFVISSEFGAGSLPGITNVTLGRALVPEAVPEPIALVVWGGLALASARLRHLNKQQSS